MTWRETARNFRSMIMMMSCAERSPRPGCRNRVKNWLLMQQEEHCTWWHLAQFVFWNSCMYYCYLDPPCAHQQMIEHGVPYRHLYFVPKPVVPAQMQYPVTMMRFLLHHFHFHGNTPIGFLKFAWLHLPQTEITPQSPGLPHHPHHRMPSKWIHPPTSNAQSKAYMR